MAKSKPTQNGKSGSAVRYAVVGLGHISQNAVLPAFERAGRSELTALVSGDDKKLKQLGKKYQTSRLYNYKQYDKLLTSGEIDAVYIALPNSLHYEYSAKALKRGIHVLCEKPLCVTAKDCASLISLSKKYGGKLMTAYRLHFDPANLEAVKLIKDGTIGNPRAFVSAFAFQIDENNAARLTKKLGGGATYDIGIYCINAARYIFQDEPISVFAVRDSSDPGPKERFAEVDGTMSATLTFPEGRTALFTVSFNTEATGYYEVLGTQGKIRVDPAYEYEEPLSLSVTVKDKEKKKQFPLCDQFAGEIQYFSGCVLDGVEPETSGEEGLADVRIIEAIYQSAKSGKSVPIKIERRGKRAEPSQAISISKKKAKPQTVNVKPPT